MSVKLHIKKGDMVQVLSLIHIFKKAGTTPKRKMAEFKGMPEVNLGDTLTVELFSEEDWVDVTGISKGKGFQGVVKRHGFGGVGGQTHGQHLSLIHIWERRRAVRGGRTTAGPAQRLRCGIG